jgi:hypothetical protein
MNDVAVRRDRSLGFCVRRVECKQLPCSCSSENVDCILTIEEKRKEKMPRKMRKCLYLDPVLLEESGYIRQVLS